MGSWTIELIKTEDGSNTLYSKKFNQHYHNIKDGALNESLSKHIIPALSYQKQKHTLHILDICFGIGYNTLTTLYYIKKQNLNIKVHIYSPEFDRDLIHFVKAFKYPNEFDSFKDIVNDLSNKLYYSSENINIEIYNGDAREYLDKLKQKDIKIDIVYQDAFSKDVNKALWTKEYFLQIKDILSDDSIITTYSIATPVRLSMWENGINIYEYIAKDTNKSTIGLNKKTIDQNYKFVDMELKKQRNKKAKFLSDFD